MTGKSKSGEKGRKRIPLFILLCFFLLPGIVEKSLRGQDLLKEEREKPFDARISNFSMDAEGKGKKGSFPPFGFKRARYDLRYLFLRSTHFHKEDIPKVILLLGTTAALYAGRKDIREIVFRHKTETRDRIYEAARISSRGAFAPGMALIFLTLGKAYKNKYHIETSQIIMESFAMSAFISGLGSFILASERPRDGKKIEFFHTGGHGISLDVALASSFVFPIADRYLEIRRQDGTAQKAFKYAGCIFLFSLPILTALERMTSDSHWAPDVFLGAFSGLAVGKILSNAHQSPQSKKLKISFSAGVISIQF